MDKMNYSTKGKKREKNKPKQIEIGCLHLTIIFGSVAKNHFSFRSFNKKKKKKKKKKLYIFKKYFFNISHPVTFHLVHLKISLGMILKSRSYQRSKTHL
jgi:hypothetical protein